MGDRLSIYAACARQAYPPMEGYGDTVPSGLGASLVLQFVCCYRQIDALALCAIAIEALEIANRVPTIDPNALRPDPKSGNTNRDTPPANCCLHYLAWRFGSDRCKRCRPCNYPR